MNIHAFLCILRAYFFFNLENGLFQTPPPTKSGKFQVFIFFLNPSLSGRIHLDTLSGDICSFFESIASKTNEDSTPVGMLTLHNIDVSNIPVNIVNNLLKIVRVFLWLYKVSGLTLPMLKDIKCAYLELREMTIPEERGDTKNVSVSCGKVGLHGFSGNVSGLLDSITCEVRGVSLPET